VQSRVLVIAARRIEAGEGSKVGEVILAPNTFRPVNKLTRVTLQGKLDKDLRTVTITLKPAG